MVSKGLKSKSYAWSSNEYFVVLCQILKGDRQKHKPKVIIRDGIKLADFDVSVSWQKFIKYVLDSEFRRHQRRVYYYT